MFIYSNMKYLVIKGWLGFGDRLEQLKCGILYALKMNRAIYVDWTDSIMSHGSESFYKYFQLVNMPVIQSLDEIPEDATVYPSFWKENLKRPFNQDIMEVHVSMPKHANLDISKDILALKDFTEDVVVFSNVGYRLFHDNSEFIANTFRVIDRRIIDKVEERQKKYNLKQCWGIHLRGTDRFPSKGTRGATIYCKISHEWYHVAKEFGGGRG
jgi:hypothetical protein